MKKIAITIGDPAGIGPEIALKASLSKEIRKLCAPVLIGDNVVIEEAAKLIGLPAKGVRVSRRQGVKGNTLAGTVPMLADVQTIDVHGLPRRSFARGKPTAAGGEASVVYIGKAVRLAMEKKVDAVVTAPISKEALKLAGFRWPGHTEMIAEFTNTKEFAMMLAGGPLRVILVTIHNRLSDVPGLVRKKTIARTIRLAEKACDMMGIRKPRIAVAGLNPHAGEAGILGDEEEREIIPAIAASKKEGLAVEGPFPPDVVFRKAYQGEVDIVVCMYHDQGLIPLKMIAFESGVNVTVGLPIIRTSPDHGTAYDIAWKGSANPSSMIEAIKLAARLRLRP